MSKTSSNVITHLRLPHTVATLTFGLGRCKHASHVADHLDTPKSERAHPIMGRLQYFNNHCEYTSMCGNLGYFVSLAPPNGTARCGMNKCC